MKKFIVYPVLTISVLLFGTYTSRAQETMNRNSLGIFIGHAHLAEGINEEGNSSWKVLPSWGIDYDFSISETLKIGLHSDWVVENYAVLDEEGIIEERSRPITGILAVSYAIVDRLYLSIGGGLEVAKEKNYQVFRLGLEYGWELQENWELKFNASADYKIRAYSSVFLGLGVARSF